VGADRSKAETPAEASRELASGKGDPADPPGRADPPIAPRESGGPVDDIPVDLWPN